MDGLARRPNSRTPLSQWSHDRSYHGSPKQIEVATAGEPFAIPQSFDVACNIAHPTHSSNTRSSLFSPVRCHRGRRTSAATTAATEITIQPAPSRQLQLHGCCGHVAHAWTEGENTTWEAKPRGLGKSLVRWLDRKPASSGAADMRGGQRTARLFPKACTFIDAR